LRIYDDKPKEASKLPFGSNFSSFTSDKSKEAPKISFGSNSSSFSFGTPSAESHETRTSISFGNFTHVKSASTEYNKINLIIVIIK